jgi:hypothetical protein
VQQAQGSKTNRPSPGQTIAPKRLPTGDSEYVAWHVQAGSVSLRKPNSNGGFEMACIVVSCRSSVSSRSLVKAQAADDILVVSLLDGRILGVNPDSGSIIWTFDTGAPLVSVRQSESTADGDASIFPGTDGGLYAYHHGMDARLEVGPTHVTPHM